MQNSRSFCTIPIIASTSEHGVHYPRLSPRYAEQTSSRTRIRRALGFAARGLPHLGRPSTELQYRRYRWKKNSPSLAARSWIVMQKTRLSSSPSLSSHFSASVAEPPDIRRRHHPCPQHAMQVLGKKASLPLDCIGGLASTHTGLFHDDSEQQNAIEAHHVTSLRV